MTNLEIKAKFKSMNIKDKTVLQFELWPGQESLLSDLTQVCDKVVFLNIESEQPELPIDVEDLEYEYEQPLLGDGR